MFADNRLINRSMNGSLSFCNENKLFRLVFNNLCFELYEWELKGFTQYLEEIDIDYWEKMLKQSLNPKKIPVSVGCNHLMVLITRSELFELKQLLGEKPIFEWLKYEDIDYNIVEN